MFLITKFLPHRWRQSLKDKSINYVKRWMEPEYHGRAAYSQEGEDLVISRLLGLEERERTGFYVDIGAHHPTKYSNTQYFYERGWRGINIDATPGSMNLFRTARPRDANLEVAVAETEGELTFYQFATPELNGFDEKLAMARGDVPGCRLTGTTQVAALPLSRILSEQVSNGMQIDFMSVDVEGLDLEVLRSNDWKRFRPLLVLVEDGEAATLDDCCSSAISQFLGGLDYEPLARTALTVIYADRPRISRGLFGVRVGWQPVANS